MSGLPDVDTFATLGGALVNFDPIQDPTTDLDAGADNLTRMNAAAMTHTVGRLWAQVTMASGAAPTLVAHDSVWGNAALVAPTFTYVSTGTVTCTWPSTVTDENLVTHSVNFRAAYRPSTHGVTLTHAQLDIVTANTATLRTYNAAGSLADVAGLVVDLFIL